MTTGWRSAGGWLGLLVCVLLAGAVALVRPDLTQDRFTVISTDRDGTAHTAAFDVAVESVEVTGNVVDLQGESLATDHQWVVVRYHLTAHRERLRTDQVWLITAAGDKYAAREEFRGLTRGSVDAGFRHTGAVVFEVPPEAIPGAVLQFGPAHADRRSWDVAVRHDPELGQVAPELSVTPPPPEVMIG